MLSAAILAALLPLAVAAPAPSVVNQTTCNGKTYQYNSLAGYGFIPGNSTDKFGDTIGGIGSAVAIWPSTWRLLPDGSYTGILWTQPDRGWNTNGTLNYAARVHKFAITLTPAPNASLASPSPPNLHFTYLDSILYRDPYGTLTTGLDADFHGNGSYVPFATDLPVATYSGDGFGSAAGGGGRRVTVDAEGLIFNEIDGSFFTSDEYGPYIYHYGASGLMQGATAPPPAFIPLRNGTQSFSADSPPAYEPDLVPNPTDPTQGRANNQGFEGLTISPDGKTLTVLLQSALIQDGGSSKSSNFNARLLQYNVSTDRRTLTLKGEYVVPLPTYVRADGKTRTAQQSEIHDLGSGGQFLVLARDSNAGRAAASTLSLYRHADIFDISNATNLQATEPQVNAINASIASSKGKLASGITPAAYCTFLDYNVNSELGKFGLHNGGQDDPQLLNEKWESFSAVPQLDRTGKQVPGKWFLISLSDDDFITQDGHLNFGRYKYADATGANLDNQALVFDITLPVGQQAWQRSL